MRWFRLVAGAALICLVVVAWQRREPVIEAYTEERPPVQIDFDGLDFNLANRVDVGPSPLVVPAAPDTRTATLTSVAMTPPPAEPTALPVGSMRLTGTVRNKGVPVPFATVRLEHHRPADGGGGTTVATAEVLADEFGQWDVDGVAGGRWRIRGFVPGVFGSSESVVQFIADRDSASIDLTVVEPDPRLVLEVVAQPSLLIGQQGTVAVTTGVRRIDAEGKTVIEPVSDATVTLTLGPDATLRPLSDMAASSNTTGAATFGFACDAVGTSTVTAVVSASIQVTVPGPAPEASGDGSTEQLTGGSVAPVVTFEQRDASLSASLPVCELPPPPPEDTAPERASGDGTPPAGQSAENGGDGDG